MERGRFKRISVAVLLLLTFSFSVKAQTGYDIKINLKGCKDTLALLLKYTFDQTYICDSCKRIKNGLIQFKGKTALDKGVYILVNQDKVPYFEFLVNESQNLNISSDMSDIVSNLSISNSKENGLLFDYVKYGVSKNKEFNATRELAKGKSKEDSTRMVNDKIMQLNEDVKKSDEDFMTRAKGTFVHDLINLKTEKIATEIPKAKNGRPDSTYPYFYYKNHYFDGVDFKDERIARTPYFDDRIKKYFDQVVINDPDSVIVEIDRILAKCTEGNLIYRSLLAYFTYKYEQAKLVSFDKVFVHLGDNYIVNGKAKGIYPDESVKAIKERIDIMRHLLAGKKVPDLFMIDTINGRQVMKLGFDTVSSSQSITNLYYKHQQQLAPLFKTLYQVNAKYTLVLFWAADCGHCQTEVPLLHEKLKELKGKVDLKVYAVQTKDDQFDAWKKFIITNKLNDFSHVFDPVHLNHVKEKFDVVSTPLIYILDRDKRIIVKKLASEQVVDFIKSLEREEQRRNQ